MALALDRNLQAPASVRAAVRKLARLHEPDERTLVWQRKLQEYTSGEHEDPAATPPPASSSDATGQTT